MTPAGRDPLGRSLPGRPLGHHPGQRSSGTANHGWTPALGSLPVLPVLVRSAARQHADARALLQAARGIPPGDVITAAGAALVRSETKPTAVSVWAGDPTTGKRRNLTAEEDRAFLAWDDRRGAARHRHPR